MSMELVEIIGASETLAGLTAMEDRATTDLAAMVVAAAAAIGATRVPTVVVVVEVEVEAALIREVVEVVEVAVAVAVATRRTALVATRTVLAATRTALAATRARKEVDLAVRVVAAAVVARIVHHKRSSSGQTLREMMPSPCRTSMLIMQGVEFNLNQRPIGVAHESQSLTS